VPAAAREWHRGRMADYPLIASNGTGWFLDGLTGDVVLKVRSVVTHRIGPSGATTSIGAVVAPATNFAAFLAAAATVSGTLTAGALAPGAPTALIKTAKVVNTAAQLKALAATPRTIVPAVAGAFLQLIACAWKFNHGSEVLAEPTAPDDMVIRYDDGAGVIASTSPDSGVLICAAADAYATALPVVIEGGAVADLVNVPLVLHNTGDEWTGNASNDASLETTVLYIEHDVS